MTLTTFKTIGFGAALLGAFALSASMAFAHDDARGIPFLKEPTVVIGGQGNALVRGAEVTAVSGDVITAKTAWDDVTLTWTVRTDSGTDFVAKDNTSEDFEDIDVGDSISFSGALTSALTVDATAVREWPEEPTPTPDKDHGKDDRKDDKGSWHPFLNFWSGLRAHFAK